MSTGPQTFEQALEELRQLAANGWRAFLMKDRIRLHSPSGSLYPLDPICAIALARGHAYGTRHTEEAVGAIHMDAALAQRLACLADNQKPDDWDEVVSFEESRSRVAAACGLALQVQVQLSLQLPL